MRFKILITTTLLFTVLQSISQEKKENYLGSWNVAVINNKIATKWSIPTELYYGTYKFFNGYHDSYIRTGITFHPTSKISTTVGFSFVDMEPFTFVNSNYNSEQNVVYEELNLNHTLNKLKIGNRFRLENRWTKAGNHTSYNNRFRYRLQLTHPINNTFYATFYNEFFVNFKGDIFNQNRVQCSLGNKASKDLKLECGYLLQSFSKVNYNRLRLVLLFNIDWRKKQSN